MHNEINQVCECVIKFYSRKKEIHKLKILMTPICLHILIIRHIDTSQ